MSSIETPQVLEHTDHVEWDKAVASIRPPAEASSGEQERAKQMLDQFDGQVKAAEQAVAKAKQAKDAVFSRLSDPGVDLKEVEGQMASLDVDLEKAKAVHASKTAFYEKARRAYQDKFGQEVNPHTLN